MTGRAGPRPRRGTASECATDIRAGLPPCRPLSFADAHFAPVKPPDPSGDIAGLRHERKTSDSPTAMRPAGRRARRPSASHTGCPSLSASGSPKSPVRAAAKAVQPSTHRSRPPPAHTSLRSVPCGTGRHAGAAQGPRHCLRARETVRHHRLDGDFTPRLLCLYRPVFPARTGANEYSFTLYLGQGRGCRRSCSNNMSGNTFSTIIH